MSAPVPSQRATCNVSTCDADVIVIGGGLAGCSAAAQLARRGHRVLLLEKGSYPRHRLCGEFLSPETQRLFADLGVAEAVADAEPHAIDRLVVTTPGGTTYAEDLPGTALGLSRYRLDALLFDHARARGADARTGTRAGRVTGTLADGFTVETRTEAFRARLVLGAFGKRSTLDRTLERDTLRAPAPFVAFKAHYAGDEVPHAIELHNVEDGYAGLSHVEGGRLNLCWIMHERALKAAGGTPEAVVGRALRQNPALAARLDRMTRVTDFCAVSNVTLAPKTAFEGDVAMLGDAAGMIAPMCGDGMAMALQSAALAAPLADAFLAGRLDAAAYRTAYAEAWQQRFALRMRLGRWLHHAYLRPGVAALALRLLHLAPPVGRWLIRHTRG